MNKRNQQHEKKEKQKQKQKKKLFAKCNKRADFCFLRIFLFAWYNYTFILHALQHGGDTTSIHTIEDELQMLILLF